MLDEVLTYLEEHTDLEQRAEIERRHIAAMNFQPCKPPLTIACRARDDRFKAYPYAQAYEDPQAMMVNELASNLSFTSPVISSQIGDDFAWQIRANYGVGVIASVFGAECTLTDDNMPWVQPVDSVDQIKRIVARGCPDVHVGLAARVIETNQFYKDKLADYPKLSRAVHVTQPDLGGPMDVAHLIWGGDIMYAPYDHPQLLSEFLSLISETYIAVFNAIQPSVSEQSDDRDFIYLHWGLVKGHALLKNDTSIMLSPEQYNELVKAHDQRILDAVDGGGIHSCGDFGQLVDPYLSIDTLKCLDIGQSYLLDIAKWYPILLTSRLI